MTHIETGFVTSAQSATQLRERYDAFKAKGLTLNLTRGKPSAAQLELSAALLSLPGAGDYLAEDPRCVYQPELLTKVEQAKARQAAVVQ